MKKIKILTGVSVVFIFSLFLYAQNFWGGKVLSAKEVKAKWGDQAFNSEKFKAGSYDVKAKMAYSVMTNKALIGKTYEEIQQTFGTRDGFYFIDTYPAYLIQKGKSHSEETWQIVFRMNNEYKVRDIIVHKNCCEK